ncbi:MAG: CHAT domain-containing protein [Desulfobacterales bacterium]|nr:CHAT domain-containing protein [Desulfobacterales bacterium]
MGTLIRHNRLSARFDLPIIIAAMSLLLLGNGCVEKKMTVKEARAVTVSMETADFEPPPRRIGDILDVLAQPGAFNPDVARRYLHLADAPLPDSTNQTELAAFFYKRGIAANNIGRSRQALDDLRSARQYSSGDDRKYSNLLFSLGNLEAQFGNVEQAIKLTRESLSLKPRIKHFEKLVKYYSRKGDFKTVKRFLDEGLALAEKIGRKAKRRKKAPFGLRAQVNGIKAQYHGSQGQHAQAEIYLRKRIANLLKMVDRNPRIGIHARMDLSVNLRRQGRLMEAEIEARQALREALGLGGQEGDFTARAVIVLGKVILKQKRFEEAGKLGRAGLRIMEKAELPPDSFAITKARQFLIVVLGRQADFTGTVAEYDYTCKMLKMDGYQHRLLTLMPELLLALIKVGRIDEASAYINKTYAVFQERFGDSHRKTAIRLGLRGIAHYSSGRLEAAYEDFSRAMPIIQKQNFGKDKVVPRAIAETYLDLLIDIQGSQLEAQKEIKAAERAFKIADRLRGRSVQSAIAAATARLSGLEPELADLARKEQDLSQRTDALQGILFDILAMPPGEHNPATIADLREQIETMSRARQAFLDEIETRFPKYFELRRPGYQGVAAVKKILFADEAMIAIHPGERRTVIWAFSRTGPLETAVVNLGRKELERRVTELRRALDPGPATLGDIPAFDLTRAHDLFRQLLAPVRPGWQGAANLLVVAQGPLGRLPFSVLVMDAVSNKKDRAELFGRYKGVPWLIKKTAITRLPAVSILAGLRSLPARRSSRMTFAGFGDPFFTQVPPAAGEKGAGDSAGVNVRGIRVSEKTDLDSWKANSVRLNDLSRLPDTADEIKGIAGSLGADLTTDVFLGRQASEHRIKSMDLSGRKVVAFATHALVPGDLDGLDQPALALTAPQITGEDEDGLLTMEEVFRLKLDADWIVLSACNTGAADGAGSEAASGLGRAFFFAGARAILVSMWPVETTSAARLTTAIFRHQQADRALSRAGAVRAAMLELIGSRGLVDAKTGKTVASYAHPLFWAPFITVGDGS